MLHSSIIVINLRTNDPDVDLDPLSPRSIVLSLLLGTHPPSMPVGRLLAFTSLFGITTGTARTALSRMVARGELDNDNGIYRLGGRLLERKAQQDAGRLAAPTDWDGTWWFVAVLAQGRSVADRRAFRSRVVGARLGELRADTWLRPANIEVPTDLAGVIVTRGPLVTGDDEAVVRRLWNLDEIDARARSLVTLLDHTASRLATDARTVGETPQPEGGAALADAFVQLAACQRFLRTEPQLPESLDPGRWSAALRSAYADVVVSFQQRLGEFFAHRRQLEEISRDAT
jgi:phenylacetic acid degradation operon negative regulatory protein